MIVDFLSYEIIKPIIIIPPPPQPKVILITNLKHCRKCNILAVINNSMTYCKDCIYAYNKNYYNTVRKKSLQKFLLKIRYKPTTDINGTTQM